MFDALLKICRYEGPTALWNGLTPALLRQISYSSMCMVLYEPLRDRIAPNQDQISFLEKLAAGGIAGALSIAIANPYVVGEGIA